MRSVRPTLVWRQFQNRNALRLTLINPLSVPRIWRFHHSTAVPIASLIAPRSTSFQEQANISEGDTVQVNGFVRSIRKQKNVAFVAIGDGSTIGSLQVVLHPEQAGRLSTGVSVTVTGQWKASPSDKEQTHELHAQEIRILGDHDTEAYPLQKKYHSPEFLRTIPHLRARLPFNSLLLRLRSQIITDLTIFFSDNDYVQTHTPILTSSDCEGAGEVFTVTTSPSHNAEQLKEEKQFFRNQTYLTVSSQLHLEAFAQAVGKVWTLSPAFRAEKSDTPRHLSEFYMLEAELAFAEDPNQVMDLAESMLRYVTTKLRDSSVGAEILRSRALKLNVENAGISAEDLHNRWQSITRGPWPRITYVSAIGFLQDAALHRNVKFDYAPSYGLGLQAEHEKYLAETIGSYGPIFVTDYPQDIKPFYMAPSKNSSNSGPTVACFDLLVPEFCEIVGGSIREHRLSNLLESMRQHGLGIPSQYDFTNMFASPADTSRASDVSIDDQQSLSWYLDLRKYGSVPHGGFGLGFDRLLCYLSGVTSIRDIVGFPRWHGRCDC